MKFIKKELKQNSLIHQKIRQASFVPVGIPLTEKFKYNLILNISKYIDKKFIVVKTVCNKIIQKPRLWVDKIDFRAIKNDVSSWLIEALVEGFIINFILWALIGFEFSFVNTLALGSAVKQILSIYWRLKYNGANSTIPQKDK